MLPAELRTLSSKTNLKKSASGNVVVPDAQRPTATKACRRWMTSACSRGKRKTGATSRSTGGIPAVAHDTREPVPQVHNFSTSLGDPVVSVCISHDDTLFCACGSSGLTRVYSIETGALVAETSSVKQ
eukprot:2786954-Prymnesium_polylepis.1